MALFKNFTTERISEISTYALPGLFKKPTASVHCRLSSPQSIQRSSCSVIYSPVSTVPCSVSQSDSRGSWLVGRLSLSNIVRQRDTFFYLIQAAKDPAFLMHSTGSTELMFIAYKRQIQHLTTGRGEGLFGNVSQQCTVTHWFVCLV